MTIEQTQRDFDDLIEKNGFALVGRTSDTGTPLYHRVWKKTVTHYDTLNLKVPIFMQKENGEKLLYEVSPKGVSFLFAGRARGDVSFACTPAENVL